jgi:hypothetical protein
MWCLKCNQFHVDKCPLEKDSVLNFPTIKPEKPLLIPEIKISYKEPLRCTCSFFPMGSAGWTRNPKGGGTFEVNNNCPIHGTNK